MKLVVTEYVSLDGVVEEPSRMTPYFSDVVESIATCHVKAPLRHSLVGVYFSRCSAPARS